MKKLLLVGIAGIAMFTASAQKIGFINTDELISTMPEAIKADGELKEFQAGLAQNYQDLSAELNSKDSAFVADSLKLSPSMKEIKRKELVELYQRVQNYQQESQQEYQQEADKKIAPIREKALTAIKAVAKENGYTYVVSEETLLVMPPENNILSLVKTKLGIKDTPKTAPATTPATRPAAPAGKRP